MPISLRETYRNWKRASARRIKGTLRRRADEWLPGSEIRRYRKWITERVSRRAEEYTEAPQPGLLSILTPVWDGSPVPYLERLARSLNAQVSDGGGEWVILDNGCRRRGVLAFLDKWNQHRWVTVVRAQENVGITPGLRLCLEHATGRYVLPVDADDLLYPDALRVVASSIVRAGYPPLLYTDEDKVIGSEVYQPYLKPDWDPVLLLNSAYIAHLGVVQREKALALGAYGDREAEGSPDWDLFVRFLAAGYQAIHIPEIVYSWRVHPASTADDAATKPYIVSSQTKVLKRFLDTTGAADRFEIEASALFGGGAHFHFRRKPLDRGRLPQIVIGEGSAVGSHDQPGQDSPARSLAGLVNALARTSGGFLCFVAKDLTIDASDWESEAIGIFELHSDAVMIGGCIRNGNGRVIEAGLEFGFGGLCGSPNQGRSAHEDPGYFGQMWKQRSVGAVSTNFAVIRAGFLAELLAHLPDEATVGFLGAWAGAFALRHGRRVVYSPFLSGVLDVVDQKRDAGSAEMRAFQKAYGSINDTRYYPAAFSRREPYRLVKSHE